MYLGGTRLWAMGQSIAANATHVSLIGIRNPVNSGVLIVVTSINVGNPGAVAYTAVLVERSTGSAAVSSLAAYNRDSRAGFASANGVQTLLDNTNFLTYGAYNASQLEQVTVAAGQGDQLMSSTPYILAPQSELSVLTTVVNQQLLVDMSGYYRPLAAQDLL